MNIFHKVALEGLKKSRTRTLVTIIGVALSAAMITAVTTFAVSLQNYMVEGAMLKYGDWHVEFLDVDSAFVKEQMANEKVAHTTTFENIGYARMENGQNQAKPYFYIAGFSEETFADLPIKLVCGRLPQNSEEILVPAHVMTNGGGKLAVGDTVCLNVGERRNGQKLLGQHDPYCSGDDGKMQKETFVPQKQKTYTVVGICERPAFEEYTAPGYTLITRADTEDAVDNLSLFVSLKNPRQVHSYANNTAQNHAYVYNDDVLRFMGFSDDKMFNALLYSIGGILIILIMLGSVFLIYNSFTIALNDRMRQFGILMSVGATEKQLRKSVLFEGFCIGVIGIPFGILIGIPSIKLVLSLTAKNFANVLYDNVPLTLTVSAPALIVAVLISMLTILISAYIPARKAASIPVMECIRQTNEIKVASNMVKMSKLERRMYGFTGTLALKNFKRNKRRYRSIVLSLTLSVVLFVSASTYGTHLKQAAERAVVDSDYDIYFCTKDMDEGEMFDLYDTLKRVDGVYDSSYQAIANYSCTVKTSDFSEDYRKNATSDFTDGTCELSMDVQFLEDDVYFEFLESLGLSKEEYTGENAKMLAVAKAKKTDDGKHAKTELINMFTDSSMNFTILPKTSDTASVEEGQDINVTFIDTIPVDTLPKQTSEVKPYVFMVMLPYQAKANFENADASWEKGLTFSSKNASKSVEEMQEQIERAGITSEYTLYNCNEILEENRNMLFIVDLFTVVFVIMISLIAIANVFNTISTNIRLRRRELAMLRSVGMSDRDFNKMMCFESALYGLRTLLYGIPISAILSWLIYKGIVLGGADIAFVFPWSSMGISILVVFLVIFITMLYAVSKIKKENIIDALRDDMT